MPEGVTLVRAANAGPDDPLGDEHLSDRGTRWVIDPGPADRRTSSACGRRRRRAAGSRASLLTHRHLDHARPCRGCASRRGAQVVAGPKRPEHGAIPSPPPAGWTRRRCSRRRPCSARCGSSRRPGHAADHVSFLAGRRPVLRRHGAGRGQRVRPARRRLDGGLPRLAARACATLDAEALCPGHGPVVWDPRAKLDEYLEHRLDRERRLRRGARPRPAQPRRAARRGLGRRPAGLRPAAALTLEAHLDKLEREGRLPRGVERLSL